MYIDLGIDEVQYSGVLDGPQDLRQVPDLFSHNLASTFSELS